MRLRNPVIAALSVLGLVVLPASAADLVVIESTHAGHQPGQVVDGDAALALPAGTKLVLVSADGAMITVQGPFNGKAGAASGAPAGGGGAVVKSLASLVTARSADTASLGAVRAAGTAGPLPAPWLIDVANSGHACLLPGEAPVLWRAASEAEAQLTLAPADRSWSAATDWPAGTADLALPADVPLTDGGAYVFDLSGQAASITLHLKPAAIAGDKMVAAWMAAKGCDRQAQALLAVK